MNTQPAFLNKFVFNRNLILRGFLLSWRWLNEREKKRCPCCFQCRYSGMITAHHLRDYIALKVCRKCRSGLFWKYSGIFCKFIALFIRALYVFQANGYGNIVICNRMTLIGNTWWWDLHTWWSGILDISAFANYHRTNYMTWQVVSMWTKAAHIHGVNASCLLLRMFFFFWGDHCKHAQMEIVRQIVLCK